MVVVNQRKVRAKAENVPYVPADEKLYAARRLYELVHRRPTANQRQIVPFKVQAVQFALAGRVPPLVLAARLAPLFVRLKQRVVKKPKRRPFPLVPPFGHPMPYPVLFQS